MPRAFPRRARVPLGWSPGWDRAGLTIWTGNLASFQGRLSLVAPLLCAGHGETA